MARTKMTIADASQKTDFNIAKLDALVNRADDNEIKAGLLSAASGTCEFMTRLLSYKRCYDMVVDNDYALCKDMIRKAAAGSNANMVLHMSQHEPFFSQMAASKNIALTLCAKNGLTDLVTHLLNCQAVSTEFNKDPASVVSNVVSENDLWIRYFLRFPSVREAANDILDQIPMQSPDGTISNTAALFQKQLNDSRLLTAKDHHECSVDDSDLKDAPKLCV